MSEQATTTQTTGGDAGAAGAQKATEQQAQTQPQQKTETTVTMTQAELDRINAKHRNRAEAAEAKLKEIEDARKSESEKALDLARSEERTKAEAQIKALRIEHGIQLELARRGLDPDLLPAVIKRAGEITAETDIEAAVSKALEGKAWGQPAQQAAQARPSQTGAPAQEAVRTGRPWGDKAVRDTCRKIGYEKFNKLYAAEVEEDRKAGVYVRGTS